MDLADTDAWLRQLDYYAWLHQELDVSLTRLLGALDAHGIYDDTTIIYTSGSTGAPKGVMISFGSMAVAARGLLKQAGQAHPLPRPDCGCLVEGNIGEELLLCY